MQAKVPVEWAKLFNELYPMYGAVSFFIRASLEEFLKESLRNPTFRDQVNRAVENMVADSLETNYPAETITRPV
jgi:hypothetical protein